MTTNLRSLRNVFWRFGALLAIVVTGFNGLGSLAQARNVVSAWITPGSLLSYPVDPTTDILWSAGMSGVADIQAAFNNARATESAQRGLTILPMTLPSQAQWDAMSDNEKAFWLIERERIDRSVRSMHGTESNVISVAQNYAQFLFDHDAFGHYEDGHNPMWRMQQNPTIGACANDYYSENLALFVASGMEIPLPVERSIYGFMYEDGDCCAWGHRHNILYYPYNDNSGTPGMEGFVGIGRANGSGFYYFDETWEHAEIIVMDVFDPCASWTYAPSSVNLRPGLLRLPFINR